MNNVMAIGSCTKSPVVPMLIGLAVSLLSVPFGARGGGGDSGKNPYFPPAYGLPDRTRSSDAYPPRSDQAIRALPSSRSHYSLAQPQSGGYWQSGSGDRHRESIADLAQRINRLAKDCSARGRRELATAINQLPKDLHFAHATAKDLSLLTNSIGKLLDGRGEQTAAIQIMNTLAWELCRRDLGHKQWQSQNLAMVVNGLSKGGGKAITRALSTVAWAVVDRKPELGQWTAQHLAMAIGGLSKGSGEPINRALNIFAQAVAAQQRQLDQWTAQHLAMVVHGLSKGTGVEITTALTSVAQSVSRRTQELNRCTALDLAMLACGFSEGMGAEVATCFQALAQEVATRDLRQWTLQDLVMVASGLGQVPHTPAFDQLITELVNRATQEPRWLLIPLKYLCRLQLSRAHMDAAFCLLDALYRYGYRPDRQDAGNELLWCVTLVHFTDRYLLAAPSLSHNRSDRLAKLYRHYIEIGGWGEADDTMEQKAYHERHDVKQDRDKRWHSQFARDYWQGEHQRQGGVLPFRRTVSSSRSRRPVSSQTQFNIYQTIKTALGEHNLSNKTIAMEVSINDFPVDILIDERICIEVDGPYHYLQSEQKPDPQNSAAQSEHGDNPISVLPSLPV